MRLRSDLLLELLTHLTGTPCMHRMFLSRMASLDHDVLPRMAPHDCTNGRIDKGGAFEGTTNINGACPDWTLPHLWMDILGLSRNCVPIAKVCLFSGRLDLTIH